MEDIDQFLVDKLTSKYRTGYINIKGFCLPELFASFANEIENLEVRDDDTWVCSFPKTGTTWTQEMVWCIANNLDFEGAATILTDRFPFLEATTLFYCQDLILKSPELAEHVKNSVNYVKKMPSPRFIKSHIPFELLPRQIRTGERKPKIVYVTRNPKDTCISYYHHCKIFEAYRGNFEEFCTLFLAGKLTYAPFANHVIPFWERRNQTNLLFIKYEDMMADLPLTVMKVAEFLGKQLNENEVNILANHLSFQSMKINPSVNREKFIETLNKIKFTKTDGKFMRCGQVNQWKVEMCPKLIEQFDKWINQHLEIAGLYF